MATRVGSVPITVKTLLANSGVTALVGQRIYPYEVPQDAAANNIAVHLIYEDEQVLLAGATQWPQGRVSVECRAESGTLANDMAEAVKDALRDKHLYSILGCEVTFRKEGTDVTDSSQETNASGGSDVNRRILDFYVRWRVST